jgi:hypothetical protein
MHYCIFHPSHVSIPSQYQINLLKPSGNFKYDQVYDKKILRGAHTAFMCFVRISEQTATFAL